LTELVNTLGPELFPDFEHARIVADPIKEGLTHDPSSAPRTPVSASHSRESSASSSAPTEDLTGSSAYEPLPRNESFGNLGGLSFFASRPQSRSRSSPRGLSESFKMSSLTTKDGLDEVSKKIRGAMMERGKARRRTTSEGSWEFTGSGEQSPVSEEGKKEL